MLRKPKELTSTEKIEAAVVAFIDEGKFSERTVADITEKAGVGKSTFYRNYKDKYDVLERLISGFLAEQETIKYAEEQLQLNADKTPEQLAAEFDTALAGYTDMQCADYYDSVFEFSNSTYELNMHKLGYVDLEQPTTINLFASSFADKDVIEEMINTYNKGVDEISRIEYTDYMGIMMILH